ncbi:hypothetical protein B9Z55_009345 [Caenorhabditis nigoni]|uniref:Uncharacterized protein n=1 Tax=Caenorhabditis nigoni TaxID=1611254 RepID=A0A2G5URV2_9PELO|nr:hypothetical protein B9Z55_009345 [Caenorhabditis nigoni]
MSSRWLYNVKLFIILFLCFTVFLLLFYPEYKGQGFQFKNNQNNGNLPVTRNKKFLEASEEWKRCFADRLKKCREEPKEMWYWVRRAVNQCRNQTSFSKIELTGVKNKDEMKYHVYSPSQEPSKRTEIRIKEKETTVIQTSSSSSSLSSLFVLNAAVVEKKRKSAKLR